MDVPLLALDTSEINYVASDEAFEEIYQQILTLAEESPRSKMNLPRVPEFVLLRE